MGNVNKLTVKRTERNEEAQRLYGVVKEYLAKNNLEKVVFENNSKTKSDYAHFYYWNNTEKCQNGFEFLYIRPTGYLCLTEDAAKGLGFLKGENKYYEIKGYNHKFQAVLNEDKFNYKLPELLDDLFKLYFEKYRY